MTIDYIPFWYSLIRSLKLKKIVSNGPTIPYILGAYALVDKSFLLDNNCIERLLKDIINSSAQQVAILQLCPDVQQYVVGIENKEFCEKYFKNEICFSNAHGDKTLYITQNASDLGKKIESIVSFLSRKYSALLSEQTFSWDKENKIWKSFNAFEKENILSIT